MLAELEKELAAEEARLQAQDGGARLMKEEVDEEDIAEVVARWTGIPVSRLHGGRDAEAAPPRGRSCTSGSSARTRR